MNEEERTVETRSFSVGMETFPLSSVFTGSDWTGDMTEDFIIFKPKLEEVSSSFLIQCLVKW